MGNKIIQDPVHGYIELPEMFSKIVDTAEFQRLKWIEQGSFRILYPAARHDRFIHSLGTYHLSTKFAENFLRNIEDDLNINLNEDEKMLISNTFYYAALLHDIGHAPFSHTTESFFAVKTRENNYLIDGVEIKEKLVDEIIAYSEEVVSNRFIKEFKSTKPSPHEIISAIVLISKANVFLEEVDFDKIDLELAARMVIGCTYNYDKREKTCDKMKDLMGIKNCFIKLLNSSTVDVDKLDYITRDARMSGFFNVPIDIDRLNKSVTAVRKNNGYIYPAFRKNALSVIDNVFRAKTEQGLWMVSHPIVIYDSALRENCINKLNKHIHEDYTTSVFTVKALSLEGIDFCGRQYRLLNDTDISYDLRKFYDNDDLIKELYQRDKRRKPLWKSYYEYKYLFDEKCEDVVEFFQPLIEYMRTNNIFVFNESEYLEINGGINVNPEVKKIASFLRNFADKINIKLDFVIIFTSNTFSAKFDPKKVYIHFNNLPKCRNEAVSYDFLKGKNENNGINESKRFFYFFSKEKFNKANIEIFIEDIIAEIGNLDTEQV